jgi:hypothetical protein
MKSRRYESILFVLSDYLRGQFDAERCVGVYSTQQHYCKYVVI